MLEVLEIMGLLIVGIVIISFGVALFLNIIDAFKKEK